MGHERWLPELQRDGKGCLIEKSGDLTLSISFGSRDGYFEAF
jgi:hypothetical protein